MKKHLKIAFGLLLLSIVVSCKDQNGNGAGVGDGEKYANEQNQSDATETGQHIGNTTDSTSVGERGKISNN
jgi:hypothetical protein